ncbi:MAG: disulfide bond formation protein B [Gammaproteobacteria bacterium]|jgi:disulfide bond formation protein DsbB|nr:disulfide bond formation protein B [Gammaproteobacteria bacterium]
MHSLLINLSRQRRYWALLILVGIALECGALYFQYVLDEWPCVLCIHVRILVMSFVLIGILAIFFTGSMPGMRLFHGLNTLIMGCLVERSWQVLAVERGWVFGDCAMNLGMPSWFALDKWFPAVFEVQTACGYSPLLLFEITMAEALLVISIVLLIISATLFVSSWQD